MNTSELLKSRRTSRRFKNEQVAPSILSELVDTARLSPSAANLQSLKYVCVTSITVREKMYPHVRYAGYTPEFEQTFVTSPTAFIALFNDTSIRKTEKSECDAGIALMALSILAEEKGLGSCIFGSIDREAIRDILGVGRELELMYLVGIGYPEKKSVLIDSEDKVRYKLVDSDSFGVPKRSLDEVLIKELN
jgi:nitroreductase